MNPTLAPPTTATPIPAITSSEVQAWIARRERFRGRLRFVFVSILALAVSTVCVVWAFFHGQLLAMASLRSQGISVDWDINFGNILRGGVSTASFQSRWGGIQDDRFTADELKSLKSLLHLKSLHVSRLELRDEEYAFLSDLTELTDLGLMSRTPSLRVQGQPQRVQFTDKVLDYVANLVNLENLNLSYNRITDEGLTKLANLTKLETLDLDGTLVTDRGLDALKGFKKLKYLRVENTKVTREGVAEFQRAMPNVEVSHEEIKLDFTNP